MSKGVCGTRVRGPLGGRLRRKVSERVALVSGAAKRREKNGRPGRGGGEERQWEVHSRQVECWTVEGAKKWNRGSFEDGRVLGGVCVWEERVVPRTEHLGFRVEAAALVSGRRGKGRISGSGLGASLIHGRRLCLGGRRIDWLSLLRVSVDAHLDDDDDETTTTIRPGEDGGYVGKGPPGFSRMYVPTYVHACMKETRPSINRRLRSAFSSEMEA